MGSVNFGRSFLRRAAVATGALLCLAATPVAAEIIDFESLQAGTVVGQAGLGPGTRLQVTNNDPEKIAAAIIYDSACPGGCTGGDGDLRTPGLGAGNGAAQGKMLIIAENLVDEAPADGLIDDPDDEELGGTVTIEFAEPVKVISLRVVDIETTAAGSRLLVGRVDGSIRTVPFALLGDASAQTVVVGDPRPAVFMSIVLSESGAIDDIQVVAPCGDGIEDPGEECDDGNQDDGDCCSSACRVVSTGEPCDDGDHCTFGDRCNNEGQCEPASTSCGDGVVDSSCGETCDDGNRIDGDCCNRTCGLEAAGATCQSDGNPCTDDLCDGLGACTHGDNAAPCDDGDACTVDERCQTGQCVGGAARTCDDDNPCTDDHCDPVAGCTFVPDDANECDNGNPDDDPDRCEDGVCTGSDGCAGDHAICDDGNPCTDDVCLSDDTCAHATNTAACDDGNPCTDADTCSGGVCRAGDPTDCDDANPCTSDACDFGSGCVHAPVGGSCDDASYCNGVDTCIDGECVHDGDPCAGGLPCQSTCNEQLDNCLDPTGAPCDDGDPCTDGDFCDGEGRCVPGGSTCGNGTVEPECGETCDPPDAATCDEECRSPSVCGNGVVDPGEECDDGNDNPEDGCADCDLDDLLCFTGTQAFPSRGARRIVFVSERNYDGDNRDNNAEVFLFERRRYRRAVRKGADKVAALADAIVQITDTLPPVRNEMPTANGSGRFMAFVSNGDLLGDGSNADANREVFHLDRRKGLLAQITDSRDIDNLHPALRSMRGRALLFDSPANLVPDLCVGLTKDSVPCATNADCSGGVCGNPEGNREVYKWSRSIRRNDRFGARLRQLTAAPVGDSIIGNSVNFFTGATSFASNADLLGSNGDLSREIYRIVRTSAKTVQVTVTPNPLKTAESPSQARKSRVAFASDSDPLGLNEDGNMEIFLWTGRADSVSLDQITNTQGCTNAMPAVDSIASAIVFQSTCNLIPEAGNPDQSLFVYSVGADTLLSQLVIRGPGSSAASRPSISSRKRVITFEADPGGSRANLVCIFDARRGLLETIF